MPVVFKIGGPDQDLGISQGIDVEIRSCFCDIGVLQDPGAELISKTASRVNF